jgi:hypothetical protein
MKTKSPLDVEQWCYRLVKGRIASHVARGTDEPNTVVKFTKTLLARRRLGGDTLQRVLEEVNSESVQPFLALPWNQPERLERFRVLKSGLLA